MKTAWGEDHRVDYSHPQLCMAKNEQKGVCGRGTRQSKEEIESDDGRWINMLRVFTCSEGHETQFRWSIDKNLYK